MNLRKKLYFSVSTVLSLLLLLSFFAVYIREQATVNALNVQEKISIDVLLTREAQVHFKKQVQEWKNVLLRGHVEKDYDKYLSQFIEEERVTRQKVSELISRLDPVSQPSLLANQFLTTHFELGIKYREALQVYFDTKRHNHIATDKAVRGIDRPPTDLLDTVAELVEKLGENEITAIQHRLRTTLGIILLVVTFSLSLSIWFVLKLTRKLVGELTTDPVTGLLNRRELVECLNSLITESQPAFMLLIDLDQFKLINDVCGHNGGDKFLVGIADKIQSLFPELKCVFRSNADEFVVVKPDLNRITSIAMAEQVRKDIEQYEFSWLGGHFSVTCSIAVVEVESHFSEVEAVFNCADLAIQEAKDSGRNRVVLYSPVNEGIALRQQQMRSVHEINTALSENRFILYKQRIESLRKGSELSYYEILIRLTNPDGSISSPSTFLPAAEKYNIMGKIDRWVINSLVEYLDGNDDKNYYSVNLSGATLSDPTFCHFIRQVFEKYPTVSKQLGFEITESEAVKHLKVANEIIQTLKQFDCKVALDDFGTGVSSFSYLLEFDIDVVKIDGVFIKNLLHSDTNKAIVRSVVDIADTLNTETVAEFVENIEVKELLVEMGIHYGQGFGLHKPEPL